MNMRTAILILLSILPVSVGAAASDPIEVSPLNEAGGSVEILEAKIFDVVDRKAGSEGRLVVAVRNLTDAKIRPTIELRQEGDRLLSYNSFSLDQALEPRQERLIETHVVSLAPIAPTDRFTIGSNLTEAGPVNCDTHCELCWERATAACGGSGPKAYSCACDPNGGNHCNYTCEPHSY